jgi:hypothetical protein
VLLCRGFFIDGPAARPSLGRRRFALRHKSDTHCERPAPSVEFSVLPFETERHGALSNVERIAAEKAGYLIERGP